MKELGKYLENMSYEYVITYSGLRGENIPGISSWIDMLNSRLLKMDNEKHPSLELISRIGNKDEEMKILEKILTARVLNPTFSRCAPIFRDIIVFYNKADEISGIINICFSCEWIENELGEIMGSDKEMYLHLKQFLINQGHPISNV